MAPPFSSVLLAAGRSVRMGCDKALIEISPGRMLWERQWTLLAEAGAGERLLSIRPEQTWPPSAVTKVSDPAPDLGPFGGIAAALKACRHAHLLVLAVDLPHMKAEWLGELLARRTPGRGVVPVLHRNFEPLAAVYPREIAPLMQEAAAEKDFSLQHLLAKAVERGFMTEAAVAPGDEPLFANWNEPRDVT